MNQTKKILWIALCTLFFCGVLFTVPVYAEDGEYLATIGPGETYPTKDVIYGIYQITATSISRYDGWCDNCSDGGTHSYQAADAITTTYSITVDGYGVLNYCSTSPGSGRLDLSTYTGRDAVISMPAAYQIKQYVTCVGGRTVGGVDVVPCGATFVRTVNVSGSMQLFGRSKTPVVVSNPTGKQAGTDQSVTFSVTGEKAKGYRWQRITESGPVDLRDGTVDGVTYSGTSTPQLTISNVRYALNGAVFRCILIGENGDEVASETATLTVTDVSPPRVSLSYSPTGQTYDEVTIKIQATDPDSGLSAKPYHYLNADHDSNSFSVTENGTYDVVVTDRVGNSVKSSVTISNIRPRPTPTNPPTPIPTSAPTENKPTPTATVVVQQPVAATTEQTVVKPNPKPTQTTQKTTEQAKDDKEDRNKNKNESVQKNVNIKNLTSGTKKEDITDNTDTLQAKEETVEEEEMLSDAPQEEVVPEIVEEHDPIGTILGVSFGVLFALALLSFALLFPVRLENADELGNWHFCALKCLRYHKGWELKVGLLLEDFDSLRLKFGMLFLAIIANNPLRIQTEDGEEIRITEVTQDLILHYHQTGR